MDDTLDETLYLTPQACRASGATYRQADYWARTGTLVPYLRARGSGTQRRYSVIQVRVMRIVTILSSLGANQQVLAPVALRFQEHPWLWDEEAVIVTDDGRVLVVHGTQDLVTGWLVNPRAEAANMAAWLDEERQPATLAG